MRWVMDFMEIVCYTIVQYIIGVQLLFKVSKYSYERNDMVYISSIQLALKKQNKKLLKTKYLIRIYVSNNEFCNSYLKSDAQCS